MPRARTITTDLRRCSNCGDLAPVHQMLTVNASNRTVAHLCFACQQAQKIQLTLTKDAEGGWEYFQYFPLEA